MLENPVRQWKKAAFSHRAYHINDIGVKTSHYNLTSFNNGEKLELYDRKVDSMNLYDISSEKPEVVKRMMGILEAGGEAAEPEIKE